MSIKRKEIPEPNWYSDDYVSICSSDLFCEKRCEMPWSWEDILWQVDSIDEIISMFYKMKNQTCLFSHYLDIVEANLFYLDDIFYYSTGVRIGCNPEKLKDGELINDVYQRLRFWTMCFAGVEIRKTRVAIEKAEFDFFNFIELNIPKEILKEVAEEWGYIDKARRTGNNALGLIHEYDHDHLYATKAYETKINKKAIKKQIDNIFGFFKNYHAIYKYLERFPENEDFYDLLRQFRKSEKGRSSIKVWERDFNGSRDKLIEKLEKDKRLKAWVFPYLYLREDESMFLQLFSDEVNPYEYNDNKLYDVDNWINILIVAAVLQEYDERHDCHKKNVQDDNAAIVQNITVHGDIVLKKETNIEHNYENGAQHNDHSKRLAVNSDDADKGKLLE